ncbi:hypothetical protein WJX81_004176 [Elliptochloris bilobata]|uniref:Uncharacterized protein n=1 Tax=Elliptochloris bilobata TaxID=381761 RepID=A0AAW1SEI3_9CHLO
MASELSNFIDDELKKMEEQPENQRLLSALRVKTSPEKKGKAGLAAVERLTEPRRCCGMAPRTWLALIGGTALVLVVLALVAGARAPSGQLSSQLAGLKARMPPMPTLGNRKAVPGRPDAVAPVDPAAEVHGAHADPMDPAAEKLRAAETSQVLPKHLAAAANEPPPGHKKHRGLRSKFG